MCACVCAHTHVYFKQVSQGGGREVYRNALIIFWEEKRLDGKKENSTETQERREAEAGSRRKESLGEG